MSDAAGSVNIVLSVNKANFSAAMADAQRQLDKFAGKAKGAGHGTVSAMQSASASIRLLENPLGNNTRAIERLLSQSKLLSGAMKAAFPVVGLIAGGMVLAKLGGEVAAFIKKVNEMPAALTKGFASLNLAGSMANDELQLTSDKLQNAINKLQGKPENNVKIALDEARIAADKLATSIEADNAKLNELLSKNHLTGWAILMGKAGTADREGTVKYFSDQQDQKGLEYQQAVAKGDDAGAAKALKELKDSQNAELANVLADKAKRQAQEQGGPDQSANIAVDTGVAKNILEMQNKQALDLKIAKQEAEKEKLEADKAAAAAALAAAKKAAAAQLAQWEDDHSNWKAEQDRSLLEDAAWWAAKLALLNTKSINYKAVLQKRNADIIEQNKQDMEAITKFNQEYAAEFQKTSGLSSEDERSLSEAGKATLSWITAMAQGIDLKKQDADATADATLQMALMTGQITKLDAARATAALHQQQYSEALHKLTQAHGVIGDDPTLGSEARKAALQDNANQMKSLNDIRGIQAAQDQEAINPASSSAVVGAIDALNEFADAARNSALQMKEIINSTLSNLNQNIIKAGFGEKTNFKGVGLNLAKEGAGAMLNRAEGSAMNLLGFGGGGKLGTKGNPMYVTIAQGIGSAASSAAGALGKIPGVSSLTSSGSSIMSSLSSMFQGHFAEGGDVVPGRMAWVGENGPEPFIPKTAGTIIPNHALGGTSHTYHIDARGSTDPSAVHAAVTRALPQAVAASQQVSHQRNLRRPQR